MAYSEYHVIKAGELRGHIACRPELVDGWPGWVRMVVVSADLRPIRGGKAQEIPESYIGEALTVEQVAFHGHTAQVSSGESMSILPSEGAVAPE